MQSQILNRMVVNSLMKVRSKSSLIKLSNYLCAISLIVCAMVALPLTVHAQALTESSTNMANKPTILVFGDSLSASYGIAQSQGWVSLLTQRLNKQRYNYNVVNLSISGETTSGGLSRFNQAITQVKPSIVILELGANDGLRGLSVTDTYKNLDAMIALAKPAEVLLLGMKIPPNYGLRYSAEFSDNYSKLAEKHAIKFVPFMLEGVAGKRELILDDGLHPNVSAQLTILENCWIQLKTMLKK